MPFAIHFSKSVASRHIEAILNNLPLSHSGEGWSQQELLQVAGATFFMAFACGSSAKPQDPANKTLFSVDPRDIAPQQFQNEVTAAVNLFADWTQHILDGGYDEKFEASVEGTLDIDEAGSPVVHFLRGAKDSVELKEEMEGPHEHEVEGVDREGWKRGTGQSSSEKAAGGSDES